MGEKDEMTWEAPSHVPREVALEALADRDRKWEIEKKIIEIEWSSQARVAYQKGVVHGMGVLITAIVLSGIVAAVIR